MTLLEIIQDRQNKDSLIIISQLPINGRFEVIGEKTIAGIYGSPNLQGAPH